jgi:hypothetical protein
LSRLPPRPKIAAGLSRSTRRYALVALKSPPVAFYSGSDARFNRASPLRNILFFGCYMCPLFAPVSTCRPSPCLASCYRLGGMGCKPWSEGSRRVDTTTCACS